MVFDVRDSKGRKTVTNFPHEITKMEHVWIPMSDGAKLAATIWLPKDAEENPVPAILEYLPYRKDDFTAIRDSIRHPYFAGNGYASIRIDIRGTGNSDGFLPDEYLKQEQDDALDVFDWIEKQTWATGSVGMIGKSWGGFNGLQIAARQHRALKAVITLCSTDDRYRDDVHYRGGNVLASDMLWWATTMLAYSARPQDPEVVGDSWMDNWMERLNTTPYIEEWLAHQTKDAYWKHGSIAEDYAAVKVPVFVVGGWQDGYTDPILRMVQHLPHVKGLNGPWYHEYPEVAGPEPAIGFLQECLRFWDQWLKGIDTGVDDDPKLISFIQDSMSPQVNYEERPGKWVADPSWPSPNVTPKQFWLSDFKLTETHTEHEDVLVSGMQEHGYYNGVFCPFGEPGDLPSDQRLENGKSTVFRTDPLQADIELLGNPLFDFEFSSSAEDALVAVRLCDRAPTGESTLISWGLLNLTHFKSHEHPEKLVPNQMYQAQVQLNCLGQLVPQGHRLELAISPTYWPQAWPAPTPVTLTVRTSEQTKLTLPVRTPQPETDDLITFELPEAAAVIDREILREGNRTRNIVHDTITNHWKLIDFSDEGERVLPHNRIRHGSKNENVYSIQSDDPLTAKAECSFEVSIGREGWDIRIEAQGEMTSDEQYFYVTNTLVAFHNEQHVFDKTWEKKIPRQ